MTELIVDNFAGGGGASEGIERAIGRPVDYAINHDPEALAMHRANHPNTRHLLTSVWDADPAKLCAGRPVGLGWFSPDCTFHSKARGGKPFCDRDLARRRRGLAWLIPAWARSIRDQCQSAGVSFFMKQMGGNRDKRDSLEAIPEDLRIREFPA